jgi:uncharacterized protein (DUF2164 family)
MAVTLPSDSTKQAVASITRFCTDELDVEVSGIQATMLLAFLLKEIGPSIYNAGVGDAQTFLRDRLGDLEATCYEPEFAYWPKAASVQRKR